MNEQTTRQAREELLTKALGDAAAAVEKTTTLRGANACKVANAALVAGGDALRAEHTIRLGAQPGLTFIAAALAGLAIDLTVLGLVVTGRQPRRPVAALAVASRVALFGLAHWRNRRVRAQINAGLSGTKTG